MALRRAPYILSVLCLMQVSMVPSSFLSKTNQPSSVTSYPLGGLELMGERHDTTTELHSQLPTEPS